MISRRTVSDETLGVTVRSWAANTARRMLPSDIGGKARFGTRQACPHFAGVKPPRTAKAPPVAVACAR